MSCRILLSPAGAGKTQYIIERAREAARALTATPWVVLPSAPQVAAMRRRMARSGGALNVRIATFDALYRALLDEAYAHGADAPPLASLPAVVRHRLLMGILDRLAEAGRIPYYQRICHRPGYVEAISRLVRELGQGMIAGEALAEAFAQHPEASPRQLELGTIATAYRETLTRLGYADAEQRGWHALDALSRHPRLARDWGAVFVDGFDSLNTIQRAALVRLADRVPELTITLTGTPDGRRREMAHRRFLRTLDRLNDELGAAGLDVTVEALPPGARCQMKAPLCHLERSLWQANATPFDDAGHIELLEAPSRAAEAREALRWCKERIVYDAIAPGDIVVLARSIEPYRPVLAGVAHEYGLPVHFALGLPLQDNPLIVSILDLLEAFRPAEESEGPALPRRLVVEAWACPHFDWCCALGLANTHDTGHADEEPDTSRVIAPGDAIVLDALARQGLVIGGLEQWREVLEPASQRALDQLEAEENDEDHPRPSVDPVVAATIWAKFTAFVEHLSLPTTGTRQEYVAWLEDLIGDGSDDGGVEGPSSLGILARLQHQDESNGDIAALRAFSQVLRGLVWVEGLEGPDTDPYSYSAFLDELMALVSTAAYAPRDVLDKDAVLIADIARARGLSMRAVALLGLAEAEFPAVLHEDPLLWDSDRIWLREQGLNIDPLLESDEQGYFYEAVTRARERLLVCRPTLSDGGAPWPPSPYWEELLRLVPKAPQRPSAPADAHEPASYEELYEGRARAGASASFAWDAPHEAEWQSIHAGADIMRVRAGQSAVDAHDGMLADWAPMWASHYDKEYIWSASRLESYAQCRFMLFVSSILRLKPRIEPTVGFDVGQRGTIMHEILEEVFRRADDPRDLDELLAILPETADRILKAAPNKHSFRPTVYWRMTCDETVDLLRTNIEAMCADEILGDWRPHRFEGRFGMRHRVTNEELPPLIIPRNPDGGEEGDAIRLRGVIDRIDIDSAGKLRVIDYKSNSGRSGYDVKALRNGRVLQLPIYALAAEHTLGLGETADGFYWHLGSHQPSPLKLGQEDVTALLDEAMTHCWQAIDGIRGGRFDPHAPGEGCPEWCPAVSFCWHYHARSRR